MILKEQFGAWIYRMDEDFDRSSRQGMREHMLNNEAIGVRNMGNAVLRFERNPIRSRNRIYDRSEGKEDEQHSIS